MIPPKPFQTIKQPEGSRVCVACVGAMAVGKTLAEVEAELTPTLCPDGVPFYRTRDLLGLLGRHGIITGAWFEVRGSCDPTCRMVCDFPLSDIVAAIVVRSQGYKGAEHFVFWDGEHIRDPNPAVSDTTRIEDYYIIEVYPLTYIDDAKELDWSNILDEGKPFRKQRDKATINGGNRR